MNFYSHLSKNHFRSGPLGVIVNQANITLDVATGTRKYPLREQSSVERNYLVGLWVNDPVTTPQEYDETKSIIARDAFDSTYLVLRVENTDRFEKIPLRLIQKCNDNGRPFYVNIGGRVNLSESTIICEKPASIGAGEVIQILADYAIPK